MDKDIVSQFAEKVRQRITNTTHESQPWVYITVDKAVNHFFLDRWLKDDTNLDSVRNASNKTFKSDPHDNVFKAYPIVWTGTPGNLPGPFPNRYLVIIALEDLRPSNGLPFIEGQSTLERGRSAILRGDRDMTFSSGGGGLAFLIELKL